MWESRRPQLTHGKILVKNKNICQDREPSTAVWAPTYHSQWCRQQGYCSVRGPNQGVETFLWDGQKANLMGSAKPGIGYIKIKYKWLSSASNLSWRLSPIYCGLIDTHIKLKKHFRVRLCHPTGVPMGTPSRYAAPTYSTQETHC